jgi:hypothetical protein
MGSRRLSGGTPKVWLDFTLSYKHRSRLRVRELACPVRRAEPCSADDARYGLYTFITFMIVGHRDVGRGTMFFVAAMIFLAIADR